jgi:hypothetical protein
LSDERAEICFGLVFIFAAFIAFKYDVLNMKLAFKLFATAIKNSSHENKINLFKNKSFGKCISENG